MKVRSILQSEGENADYHISDANIDFVGCLKAGVFEVCEQII